LPEERTPTALLLLVPRKASAAMLLKLSHLRSPHLPSLLLVRLKDTQVPGKTCAMGKHCNGMNFPEATWNNFKDAWAVPSSTLTFLLTKQHGQERNTFPAVKLTLPLPHQGEHNVQRTKGSNPLRKGQSGVFNKTQAALSRIGVR